MPDEHRRSGRAPDGRGRPAGRGGSVAAGSGRAGGRGRRRRGRGAGPATLAEVLTSTEALTLSPHAAPTAVDLASEAEAEAAADVAAAKILRAIADTYDAATDLMPTSADLTTVRWS